MSHCPDDPFFFPRIPLLTVTPSSHHLEKKKIPLNLQLRHGPLSRLAVLLGRHRRHLLSYTNHPRGKSHRSNPCILDPSAVLLVHRPSPGPPAVQVQNSTREKSHIKGSLAMYSDGIIQPILDLYALGYLVGVVGAETGTSACLDGQSLFTVHTGDCARLHHFDCCTGDSVLLFTSTGTYSCSV